MANQEHLDLIQQGIEVWNRWRDEHPNRWKRPDLIKANLSGAKLGGINLEGGDLEGIDLTGADLSGAKLAWAGLSETNLERITFSRADLCRADLSRASLKCVTLDRADLSRANFTEATLNKVDLTEAILLWATLRGAKLSHVILEAAVLNRADLSGVELSGINLNKADLTQADLRGANLSGATLTRANFNGADLTDTNFSHAYLGYTTFTRVDLRSVKGLDTAVHLGPSDISISTLIRSHGQVPERFLRGAGVPDALIEYIHSLAANPIPYYSCTICYAREDEAIVRRLHDDLSANGFHCWFVPPKPYPDDFLHRLVDDAMRTYDKVVLLLSTSLVLNERFAFQMERALPLEERQHRTILFPLRLDDSVLQNLAWWATKLREKHPIHDFTGWKQPEEYQRVLTRLIDDLKAETS
jgi:uncharacterized protein YjbI with pentapeptide repeats